jgi:epoxyqueuosine reductase
MTVITQVQRILARLEEQDYRGRIVSIQHLDDLKDGIAGRHGEGHFDEEFYQECLTDFTFSPPDSLPGARSIIVVAVPQPQVRVVFSWKEERVPLIIPPTYSYSTDKPVETILRELLEPEGYGLVRTLLPLKLLAVCSGLARYGRNNITYVSGMGSFHRLVAFYTDLPCSEEDWSEPMMLDQCKKCSACRKTCPTGAIASSRFLLQAERCITFHNERTTEFPRWLDSSWHQCVVGCLHCQKSCPVNREFLNRFEEKVMFSDEETALLLRGASKDELTAETTAKLEQLSILEYLDLLDRNLSVLF